MIQVTGKAKSIVLPPVISNQISLPCGCRVEHSQVYSFPRAVIGGRRFTSGEPLRSGSRCGSVVTMVRGDRSIYGLVKQFVRVICGCMNRFDLGLITWFPNPIYPDGDPLTVRINRGGVDVNDIDDVTVTSLNYIHPSRIAVLINDINDYMLMLRLEGLDTIPNL